MSDSVDDKVIVQRVFKAFYAVDADMLNELLAPECVAHSVGPGFSQDAQGFLELATQWAAGPSDDDTTIDDLLSAEGGKVVTRFTTRARHTGEVFGVQPSNRWLTSPGLRSTPSSTEKSRTGGRRSTWMTSSTRPLSETWTYSRASAGGRWERIMPNRSRANSASTSGETYPGCSIGMCSCLFMGPHGIRAMWAQQQLSI